MSATPHRAGLMPRSTRGRVGDSIEEREASFSNYQKAPSRLRLRQGKKNPERPCGALQIVQHMHPQNDVPQVPICQQNPGNRSLAVSREAEKPVMSSFGKDDVSGIAAFLHD